MTTQSDRREFLQRLATVAGATVLVPAAFPVEARAEGQGDFPAIPLAKPEGWDPIAFNRTRGLAGTIPESYHASITGPDGVKKHLGKHLPYVPATIDASLVPEGYIALMWGDPDKGYTMHPNAPRNDSNQGHGHWYNWIRLRHANGSYAEELESRYTEWPQIGPDDNGAFVVLGAEELTADGGKHTVYLAKLPAGVGKGDSIRIHGHCLTHGEYVDFLTL